ncbi:MAG: DegT/DnrJ/EryC1/StrS family aminotransferase [Anaerolineales bacterium]|nr:DegT/DnrJ/EryC1/StrS family aminotransferase [Anaerolineales bacterium]
MSSPDLSDAEHQQVAETLRQAGVPAEDLQSVLKILDGHGLSMGPKIGEFEQLFCDYIGAKHAIGVNSGTAGLHLCVRAAGIGPGDLVITTPFSFVASTNVLLFENAIPVFVDVNPTTGNLDPDLAAEAARDLAAGGAKARKWLPRKGAENPSAFKALLPVDVFGQPAALDLMRQVADEHGLKVIEDSCEALGSEYRGRKAGSLGDYGVFAFYPNKQITTGEGGVIVTDDDQAAATMRALRNQGRAPGDTWLQHTLLGYNYRLDEMSAALGVAQMARIEELLRKREQVSRWYDDRLDELPQVERYVIEPDTTRMSWFVYVVKFRQGVDRDALAQKLEGRGIPVRPYFAPIHLQPYMVKRFGYHPGDFPVTEDLGRRGLALPFSSVMTEAMVDQVCQALADSLTH